MRRIWLLAVVFMFPFNPGYGQVYQPAGHHFITNYTAKEYRLKPQNTDVTQDANGIMYFANDGGVLEYDGETWRNIKVPTQRSYSIEKSRSGVLYVGAFENFGLLEMDGTTDARYVSLSDKLKEQPIPSIRNVITSGDWIYFVPDPQRQLDFIYAYNEKTNKLDKISFEAKIFYSDEINGLVLFQLTNGGLYKLKGKTVEKTGLNNNWNTLEIKRVFVFNDSLMVRTASGFFRTDGDFSFARPYPALAALNTSDRFIQRGDWLISSSSTGLFVHSVSGELLFPFSKKYNLVDNNIRNIFLDRDQNLWVLTENGISSIDITNGLTYFNFFDGIDGAIDFLGKYRNNVIAQTRSGTFFLKERIGLDETMSFEFQQSIPDRPFGQVNFVRGNDTTLYLGDFNGVVKYLGKGKYERIFSCAPWDVYQPKKILNTLLVPDAVAGLNVLLFKGTSFDSYTVPGLENRSCRQIYEDEQGNFWLSDETNGIYRIQIKITEGRKPEFIMKRFDEHDGLPEGYSFGFDFQHKLFFGTEDGFYEFTGEKFVKSKLLKLNFAKNYTIHRASTDPNGYVWISAYDVDDIKKYFFGYARMRGNKVEWIHQPFLKVSEEKIDCIFHEDENVTWLGGPEGLFRYNKERSGNFKRNYKILLRRLRIADDSLVYAGTGAYRESEFEFPFSSQHYFFDFCATYYKTPNGVRYSYYLEGSDKTWSKYSSNHYVEFSNLYEGDYVLHVKAIDDYGNASKRFAVTFTVMAPWYRTTWAYIGYGIVFILIIVGAVRISSKGLKNIIKQRTREIEEQKHLVEEKNKEIIDSISYAERLQKAILPNIKVINDVMPDSFVLYKPKDIIAGDFYWMEIINNQVLYAVCDCTGHGVPGAMVSVVGANSLNRCVKEFQLTQPAKILDMLTILVEETFSKSDSEVKDGMDVALCAIEFQIPNSESTNNSKSEIRDPVARLQYAGANNPLWLVRNGELTEIKADKQPIGKFDKRKSFTNHTIEIKKGDAIYLCSDGYADQFGGESGKKFKYGKLKELIIENWELPMQQQHIIYNTIFENWRGEQEQTDDVCLWGVKF